MKRRVLLGLAALAACKSTTAKPPPPAEPQLIFEDQRGRQLTSADLAGATGKIDWEIVGGDDVPADAVRLHDEGRAAGGRGEYAHAIELLEQARQLAPTWPYPVYDEAYTVELQGDRERALALYQEVDRMAPRGFFTCKTSLDCLQRELAQALPAGFCKDYAALEWIDDAQARRAAIDKLTAVTPGFPAAWQALAAVVDDDGEKLRAIEQGLQGVPDGETRGLLLIDKALIVDRSGDRSNAIRILGELALDPSSTLATEMLAKATLANLLLHPATTPISK